MEPLFTCDIEYLASPHLMQIYTGFIELKERGIVDLKFRDKVNGDVTKGFITVVVNNKYKVVYDALDGFNWIQDGIAENLDYFHNNFKVDYYFKRSYSPQLFQYLPEGCKLYPLGLNYNIQPEQNILSVNAGFRERLKYAIKTSKYLKRFFNTGYLYTEDFEFFPILPKENKILFITRLWDPEEVTLEHTKAERERVNNVRLACIDACKKEYGARFTGGLIVNDFTLKNYSSYSMPEELTNKFKYVETVKGHSICVATTGLHNSIGWKFAEYVAASRAIVSEPLNYLLPGSFEKGKNYLEFESPDQLLMQIDLLLSNQNILHQMMKNNFGYYNNYVQPGNLILNTLFTIVNNDTDL
jgi:hypothetical protein